MTTTMKPVPYNLEAEEAVLGALLIDPMGILRVPFLRAEDFYLQKNRWIYEAVTNIHGRNVQVDFLTLTAELERTGRLDGIGGAAYVSQLITVVPSAINIEFYGRIVEEMAVRRRLLDAASDIARMAFDESVSLPDTVISADKRLTAVSEQYTRRGIHGFDTITSSASQMIDAWFENPITPQNPTRGYATGIADLDRTLGGLEAGLHVLAARTHMGKSSLALAIAAYGAERGKRVLVVPLEMTKEQLFFRYACARARIPYDDLRTGNQEKVGAENLARLYDVMARVQDNKMQLIVDEESTTASAIIRRARALIENGGLDLVVVDSLDILEDDTGSEKRYLALGDATRRMLIESKRTHVPWLVVHQVTREVEKRNDKRPFLADLSDSGKIENNADTVMFFYRDEYYNGEKSEYRNIGEVIVRKNRISQKTGTVYVGLTPWMEFTPVAHFEEPQGVTGW